jgi:hypothetical protein
VGGGLEATVAVGKQQDGVTVQLPETPQQRQRRLRQGYEPILVALGTADVHTAALGVHVPYLQPQALTEAKAKTVLSLGA